MFVLIDWDVAVRITQFLNYKKRKLKESILPLTYSKITAQD